MGTTLIMELNPKQNAELLLSKTALLQNPDFFGWPWSGMTTPKKTGNQAYPYRDPVPKTLIRAHDEHDKVVYQETVVTHMVLYERKSELRITIGKAALDHIPRGSIAVMKSANAGLIGEEGEEFEWDVFPPGSPKYDMYLNVCDQTIPGGRRMGWL